MVAPFAGKGLHLPFWETFLTCALGGSISAAVFFYSSEYFIVRARKKRNILMEKALKEGVPFKGKRVFTKMNRFIVKMKKGFGIIGISFWAPFFLSVPIGSIVAAKFYGDDKRTFPLIILGMFFNSLFMTTLAYIVEITS